MPAESGTPRTCPACGRALPDGATVCPDCQGPVPGTDPRELHPLIEGQERGYDEPTPDESPTLDEFGATSLPPATRRSPLGIILLSVGLALLLSGISLVIAGDLISHSVSSFNQQCAQVPGCHPEVDPSGGLYAGGTGLVVGGVILAFLSYRRGLLWKPAVDPTE